MKKQTNSAMPTPWWLRLSTFAIAALAAASATFWSLKLSAPATPLQAAPLAVPGLAGSDDQAWVRFLGGEKGADAPPQGSEPTNSRFKLMGVVAGLSRQGYALIAADGKAAKPYRVGDQLEDGLLLKAVAPRSAELARTPDGPTSLTLDLPKLDN